MIFKEQEKRCRGKVVIDVEMSDDERDDIVTYTLKRWAGKKVMVIPVSDIELPPDVKKFDITDEMAIAMVQWGLTDIIKKIVKESKEKKKKQV